MERILKNGNLITYRNCEYTLNGYEIVDDICLHLFLGEGVYAITIPCIMNNVDINTTDELIKQL
jgi:hypothetical protein